MRNILNIRYQLLVQAKKTVGEIRRTLTFGAGNFLRAILRPFKHKTVRSFKIKTFDGGADGGVRPGIDLDNTAATIAFLESERDAIYRQ